MSLEKLSAAGYELATRNHARAVLETDFPGPLAEICDSLLELEIIDTEFIRGGGGESAITQRLKKSLAGRGWNTKRVSTRQIVDDSEFSASTYAIDHYRTTESGAIALDIEWNNKDPFFDRDLGTFRRLHAVGAVSVGVVVTRGSSIQEKLPTIVRECALAHGVASLDDLGQFGLEPTSRQRQLIAKRRESKFIDAWTAVFIADKFGAATTHWSKLMDRLTRGVGNPCPLLLIGIPASVVKRSR
ncbi:MAG: BglII/BstYI family type II restriction endonuclease [Boseongicola sp.]|nr:BglII/BstYI family type II restriction endonuclease [Boseongicola sp.]